MGFLYIDFWVLHLILQSVFNKKYKSSETKIANSLAYMIHSLKLFDETVIEVEKNGKEVKERVIERVIQIFFRQNEEYEEYAIHDYELPFDIHEYTSIEEINRLCALVEEIAGTPLYDALSEVQSCWFNSVDELLEQQDDIMYYHDCNDMADVARYLVEETGALGEIPASLQNYIDYEAYGRDLEISGSFLVTIHGIFEYTR